MCVVLCWSSSHESSWDSLPRCHKLQLRSRHQQQPGDWGILQWNWPEAEPHQRQHMVSNDLNVWQTRKNIYIVMSWDCCYIKACSFGKQNTWSLWFLQELPYLGGVLDDSSGSGIWIGWLAGSGPDSSGEKWRWVWTSPAMWGWLFVITKLTSNITFLPPTT